MALPLLPQFPRKTGLSEQALPGAVIYRQSAPTFIGGIKLVVAMVSITIAGAFIVTLAGLPWVYISPLVVAGAYLFVESLYSTVNTAVSRDALEYWYGRGFRRNRIALANIARCSVVENPANFGWSIRATFLEWFYNVSGPECGGDPPHGREDGQDRDG